MLALTMKIGEVILIDGIRLKLVRIIGKQARLGIEAPPGVSILREKLVAPEKN